MSGEDDEPSRHDQQPVIVAAGVTGWCCCPAGVGGDPHRQQIVEATRTRGIRPVVRHVVDVHDELDVEHERYGAECPNQPGQPGRDWAARVDGRRSRRPETTTDTPTTNPYPTTTPTNAGHS